MGRELLLFVMECAQRIALEPRPEVRTGGIRLLFDIMTRHGVTLSGEEGLVWDMAFPLLMEVAKNAQLSDEAHRAAAAGTRKSTAQVSMPPLLGLVSIGHYRLLALTFYCPVRNAVFS